MTGKTHKALGVATGLALVIYGMRTDNPYFVVGLATAPFGAMLPDIDHDRSKLGATRKKIVSLIIKIVQAVLICGSIIAGIIYEIIDGSGKQLAAKCLICMLGVSIIIYLADSPKVKKKFLFFRKHRGIMHTLAVPLILVGGIISINEPIICALLFGVLTGYLSHLLADTTTVYGSPLAWPITEECIRIGRVRTDTTMEYIVATGLGALIIYCGYYFSEHIEHIWCLFSVVTYVLGYALLPCIQSISRKFTKRNLKHQSIIWKVSMSYVTPIVIFVVVYVFRFGVVLTWCLLGFATGMFMTIRHHKRVNLKKRSH